MNEQLIKEDNVPFGSDIDGLKEEHSRQGTSLSLRTIPKRFFAVLKKNTILQRLYYFLFKLMGKLPVKKKLIMLESYLGKQYSCNPRAIYEYMRAYYPEYTLVWSVDAGYLQFFKDKNIPYVKRFSLQWLLSMTRARYWITNSRLPLLLPKPSHTTYIQTWHGTPLKRLASDMEEVHMAGMTTQKYKDDFHEESSKWDYLISPNAYSSEIFKRAFNFNKKLIESGYPRNDYLFHANDDKVIRNLKKNCGLPMNKKVILYAPTWRDDQFYESGKYKFDLELDLNKMRDTLGEDYIIMLRMHYLVAENLDLSSYKGFAYDFSKYEDIRDLYLIADLLITDYSSVFFDYGILKRPMIFYVYDIETYRDKLRGFYFDFEKKAPGPLVKTTEEVIHTIKALDPDEFSGSIQFKEFYDRFCYLEDGYASKRVVDKIFQKNKVL
ncbi:CDP-glycerol glycerophosphotransferase (TagB/SpsB family) [Pullulanibacillus pueri]|uniref:CDP-glycerol glycerophosphotransferase family protein n=1 Tax=Pullulanibacillus pueri TaxID=1437324 RepID=A0A8J2ZTI8_9BACL|nr:CDP-glycerol glycerophosphotransferase (TagB/SpsB family) [Pullulanibacillus pueri]GGH76628.1 hypothetical protein GCM10007096_07340 [Pullulanibacillus pueri]